MIEAIKALRLPEGFAWGDASASGDYVAIMCDTTPWGAFGGVQCKIMPREAWPDLLTGYLMRRSFEAGRARQLRDG